MSRLMQEPEPDDYPYSQDKTENPRKPDPKCQGSCKSQNQMITPTHKSENPRKPNPKCQGSCKSQNKDPHARSQEPQGWGGENR
ncbi:hypothetical protein AAY473_023118 [Plecturocebus cupreus]